MIRLATILFLAVALPLAAQTTVRLEADQARLQERVQRAASGIDSLQREAEARADAVERARAEGRSSGDVERRLAASLTAGEALNRQQRTLLALRDSLAALEYRLAAAYGAQLDSLEAALDRAPASRRDSLRDRIRFSAGRYLLYSPALRRLDFDPERLRQVAATQPADSLEAALQADYLAGAAAEIDTHLAVLARHRRQIEDVLRLERGARRFLEEVDAELFAGSVADPALAGNQSLAANERDDFSNADVFSGSDRLTATRRFADISDFLRQVDVEPPAALAVLNAEKGLPAISMETYLDLIEEAETRLRTYRRLIDADGK